MKPLLREVNPTLSAELITLLRKENEHELAADAENLRIFADCGCGDDYCQSFYTVEPPDGPWGEGHSNIMLDPARGMLILDVVHGRITYVEVLYSDHED
jgi:hypothetical protein